MKIGQKVEYTNSQGNRREGIIHGIQSGVNDDGNEQITGYLIDTGRNVRVDEVHYDERDREITARVNKLVEKGMDVESALAKVTDQKDLPKSKKGVEKYCQPVQVLVKPEDLTAL